MTITYPLTVPPYVKDWRFSYEISTSKTTNPFNFREKILTHGGDRWLLQFQYESLTREKSAEVEAFLMSLRGEEGTFVFGDLSAVTPLGIGTGTPLVKGASQTGYSLLIDGLTPSTTNILKAGDWLQIDNSLYKNLTNVNSNGSGEATLDIAPRLKSHADNATVIFNNPKGIFRLAEGQVFWEKSLDGFNDFTILAVEAI